MRIHKSLFTLILLCGVLLLGAFASEDSNNNSNLVVIGGGIGDGEFKDRVYEKMVELAGGTEGKIGVISSSRAPYDWDCENNGEAVCNDPDANNSKMGAIRQIEEFESYGIDAEWIPIDMANTEVANDEALANRIDQGEFSGFFLDGGSQWRHIASFFIENDQGERIASLVMESIQSQFEQGNLMIGGNSAGAAVQATDIMVVGGNNAHTALVNGAYEGDFGSFPSDSSQLTYYEDGGMGFFDYGIPEQHFAERGREARAIRLAADTNQDMVYGIDEGTALIVTDTNTPQAEMEVMGDNGVQIFNFEQASVQDDGEPGNWAIENILSTYLTEGDRYLPDTNTAIFDSNKENINLNEQEDFAQEPSHNIFGDREFIDTATQLFNASDDQKTIGYTQETENQYEVSFEQTSESEGFYVDKSGGRTISYQNLKIDVQPISLKMLLQWEINRIHDENLNEEDYTKASWQELQDALAEAENLIDNPDATQPEMKSALDNLKVAYEGLQTAPAQYATDFSEYEAGRGVPDGWEQHWATSDYEIAESPSRLVKTSTGDSRHLLAWEDVGEVKGDVEIAALVRAPHATLPHAGTTPFQVHLHASGEAGAIDTYNVDYTGTDRSGVRIRRSDDHSQSTLGSENQPFEFHVWHHIVFQREGDMLRTKIWPYFEEEPDEWTVEVEDDTHKSGHVGIGFYSERMTQEFAWFSVGTGDQEAERAPEGIDGISEPQVPDTIEPEGKAEYGSVVLYWPEEEGADHYEIERDGELIAHGWENTSFADPNINPEDSATYRVRGVSVLEGGGEWSEELELEAEPLPDELVLPFELEANNPWTMHEEEIAFLDELEDASPRVAVEEIGRSGEDRPINLVRIGLDGPPSDEEIAENPTVWLSAGNHGDEKAAQEGVLLQIRELAMSNEPEVLDFLDHYEVIVVPKINPDGSEAINRRTIVEDLDPNRDFIELITPETQTVTQALRDHQPDIVIDAHEWAASSGSQRGEIEVSSHGNLNSHEEVRNLSYELTFDHIMTEFNNTFGFRSIPYQELYGEPSRLRQIGGLKNALTFLTESSRHAEVRRLEEVGLDQDDPEFRPRRVESQRIALSETVQWLNENVERVTDATNLSVAANVNNEGPMYPVGSVAEPPSPEDIIDPPLCGWLLNDNIEGTRVADVLDMHGVEWESGQEVTFVPAAQLHRATALAALDSASVDQLDGINSIRIEEGSGWCDPEDPPEDITAEDIIMLIQHLDNEGAFNSDEAVRSLITHMTAVSQYEKQEEAEKVVRHMGGFQDLLDYQLDNGLISENAFNILQNAADQLITKWGVLAFDAKKSIEHIEYLSEDIGVRYAGTDGEKEAAEYIKQEFESLGYPVSMQEFDIDEEDGQRLDQLKMVSRDNEEIPLRSALGSAETDEEGITADVIDVSYGREGDFPDEVEGNIALMQRGESSFGEASRRADEAGAIGLIAADNTDNLRAFRPGLSGETVPIPLVGVTQEDGEMLRSEISENGLTVNLSVQTITDEFSQNVIAVKEPEEDIEDPEIVYVTAHYDSVAFSPGANDNASGTAHILELARTMKDISVDKEIRFIAFGYEEGGLNGSRYYVDQLSESEIDQSIANFNFDMVGSGWDHTTSLNVNVVDGQPNAVWEHAAYAADRLDNDALVLFERGSSDHESFHDVGIDAANISWREPGTGDLEPTYHTPYDTMEYISEERIQTHGELVSLAILNMVR